MIVLIIPRCWEDHAALGALFEFESLCSLCTIHTILYNKDQLADNFSSPNQPWPELLKTSTLLVTYLPTLLLLHHLALLHNRHALVLPQVAALLLVLGTIILVKSTLYF